MNSSLVLNQCVFKEEHSDFLLGKLGKWQTQQIHQWLPQVRARHAPLFRTSIRKKVTDWKYWLIATIPLNIRLWQRWHSSPLSSPHPIEQVFNFPFFPDPHICLETMALSEMYNWASATWNLVKTDLLQSCMAGSVGMLAIELAPKTERQTSLEELHSWRTVNPKSGLSHR